MPPRGASHVTNTGSTVVHRAHGLRRRPERTTAVTAKTRLLRAWRTIALSLPCDMRELFERSLRALASPKTTFTRTLTVTGHYS